MLYFLIPHNNLYVTYSYKKLLANIFLFLFLSVIRWTIKWIKVLLFLFNKTDITVFYTFLQAMSETLRATLIRNKKLKWRCTYIVNCNNLIKFCFIVFRECASSFREFVLLFVQYRIALLLGSVGAKSRDKRKIERASYRSNYTLDKI